MHHSEENQGNSTHALPIFHVVGRCPTAGRVVGPVRSGLGGGGQEAGQQPILHLSFPGLQAGVCSLQGWGEESS